MPDAVEFIARHREAFVFFYVFADQIGFPLPAVPALLAVGAFAAAGQLNFGLALLACVAGSLLADTVWYTIGRARGADVLRWLCKVTLAPDSCVRRTEDVFIRYGVRALVIAKFVPGLTTIAPPLAGIVGVPFPRFVVYSAAGGFLWAGGWSSVGYVAGDAFQQLLIQRGSQIGTWLLWGAGALGAVYVVFKWIQRRRFLRKLRIARITVEQLEDALASSMPPVIVDLRSSLDVKATPFVIPGSLRIAAEELERRHHEIPRDRDIVLYCS